MRYLITAFILLSSLSVMAFEVPSLTGPVVDQVGLLSSGRKAEIEAEIRTLKSSSGPQIQVLILETIEDLPIEEVAIKVFDQWKLGDEKRDDGVLFVMSTKERKMRIEVGRGMEGAIPDITAKRIISDVIRPLFSARKYDDGVHAAVSAIQYAYKADAGGAVFRVDEFKNYFAQRLSPDQRDRFLQRKPATKDIWDIIPWWMWILLFILWGILPRRRFLGGGYYGGGGGGWSSGSGGWSGGGGSSAGGGASGDW